MDNNLLETINHILFWVGIASIIIYGQIVLFNRGIPNIETAPRVRKKIIELLRADFAARNLATYTIVDVGSGNGALTRDIARAMPDARVIGIEIAPHLVWLSGWLARRQKLNNLEYRRMDFMTYDFAGADAAVLFLLPGILAPLGKKLRAEARPGTLITANEFWLFDGWQPQEVIHVQKTLLRQGNLYVYRQASL